MQLFYVYRTVAIYKQPPLSSVNNIFTLPFVPNLWIVMFVVMSVFAVALIFLTWTSNWLHGIEMKFSIALDTVILVFAAICQQGTYKNQIKSLYVTHNNNNNNNSIIHKAILF